MYLFTIMNTIENKGVNIELRQDRKGTQTEAQHDSQGPRKAERVQYFVFVSA